MTGAVKKRKKQYPSHTSVVRIIRLRNDVAEWVDNNGGGRKIIERIHRLWDGGWIGFRNGEMYIGGIEGIDLSGVIEVAEMMHKEPQEVLDLMVRRCKGVL